MNKRAVLWGCSIALVILILLLLISGWIYFRPQLSSAESPAPPLVLVFITSPANGDEVKAGDFVTVTVKAVAPSGILYSELFLDGKSLGKVSQSAGDASWTWQAWPVGVHTLSARAATLTDEGESQTIFINVIAGDGAMQVYAEEGQTLGEVGSEFGIPPDQMTGANPNLDPAQPLSAGAPVQVPVPGGGPGGGSGSGSGAPSGNAGAFQPILVTWQFKPTEPVDQSYCYTSTGDGVWEKMPKEPFEFFFGEISFYTQVSFDYVNQFGLIQMQCWGWLGGTLKYLGQGETSFDAQKPPDELTIVGDSFVLTGVPEIPPDSGGGGAPLPPPYAVREPKDSAECAAHGHPLFAPFICDTLMNQNPKEYLILVWEWEPEACWPGYCQYETVSEVDGYHIYEIDAATQELSYLKQVEGMNNKVSAVPLPWGPKCYGVEAYTDDGGISEIKTFCPGVSSGAKKITLTNITAWVTSGDHLSTGGCSTGVQNPPGHAPNLPGGFGSQPGEVFVGAYRYESSGVVAASTYCYEDGYYNAAVKFAMDITALPANAVIDKAVLRFFVPYQDYDDGLFSGPTGGTCVYSVTRAKQDWSGVIDSDHWYDGNVGGFSDYGGPYASVSLNPTPQADVTAIVKGWLSNLASNNGFILLTVNPPTIFEDGQQTICYSGLSNIELDIYYFAP